MCFSLVIVDVCFLLVIVDVFILASDLENNFHLKSESECLMNFFHRVLASLYSRVTFALA